VKLRVPVPSTIRKLRSYYAPIEGRAGKLRLDFNENTVGCSPAVLRAIRNLTSDQLAMYPEVQAPTARLARWYGVKTSELMLTNGADGGLRQIVDTFVERRSAVLLVEPTFVMYRFNLEMAGAKIQTLRYDDKMKFPLENVMKALKQAPRLFFLANPNNPTGTLIERAVIRRMLESTPRTLFVVDEAYFDFSGVTVLPYIRRYPNLIVVRTFSKAPALAGLRMGCLFACPEVMGLLARTREPFPVNVAALVAAEATVRNHGEVKAYAAEIARARELVSEALTGLGVRVFPSATNFLLVDYGVRAPRILHLLEKRKILLRDRISDFGRTGFVRVTIGTRPQMRRLVRLLEQMF
jgi:histidinol-phosphate aminotransferase